MNLHQKPTNVEAPHLQHPTARDSAAPAGSIAKMPHREPAEAVVSGLDSDAARGLNSRRGATAT